MFDYIKMFDCIKRYFCCCFTDNNKNSSTNSDDFEYYDVYMKDTLIRQNTVRL
jgi:hypothetical protein